MTRSRTRYSQTQSTSLDGLPDRLSDWWWSFADRALEYLEDFGALALGVATMLTVLGACSCLRAWPWQQVCSG
jgi:hypothetical protein